MLGSADVLVRSQPRSRSYADEDVRVPSQTYQHLISKLKGMIAEIAEKRLIMKTMFETAFELEPDPVIEAYKKDIDRTLIRENLKLTVEERLRNLEALQEFAEEIRNAVKK